jgi:hypothetical protein
MVEMTAYEPQTAAEPDTAVEGVQSFEGTPQKLPSTPQRFTQSVIHTNPR